MRVTMFLSNPLFNSGFDYQINGKFLNYVTQVYNVGFILTIFYPLVQILFYYECLYFLDKHNKAILKSSYSFYTYCFIPIIYLTI